MKTLKKFLSMAALALVGAVMTGCSSDDDIIDTPQQPANDGKTVTLTMTVGLNGGETRALAADGTKTFAAGETMAVIYKNNSDETVMAVTEALVGNGDITNNGKTATFTVTLDDPNKTQNVTYVYPAAMVNSDGSVKDDALAEQDGTLSSLSSNLDYCTNSGAWDNGALPELTLDNQFAILAITLKDNATPTANNISSTIDELILEEGSNKYTVKRTAAEGTIYVAIRPTSAAHIEVTAYDGPVFYPKSLTAKTYEASNGYSVSWKMTRGGIDLARIKSSITVTAQDGDVIKGTLKPDPTYMTKVEIADGATVTLSDASISNIGNAGLTCLGNATINLVGTNNLNAYSLGIFVPSEKTLTIDGSGSLTATGDEAPGIGGNGNITINGGTITAHGGDNSAGIGGAYGASCGNITINGGTVTATCDGEGAGIGSGYASSCGSISITGGNVTATGNSGAGIGSSSGGGTCSSISITGGTVNATGGYGSAGIGSGMSASCGYITITDGVTKVTATKGDYWNEATPNDCIGAGQYGTCGTVTIGGVGGVITESPFVYPVPKAAAEATAEDLGKVICSNGHIHSNVSDVICGGSASAMIAYVGNQNNANGNGAYSSTCNHGLAIALADVINTSGDPRTSASASYYNRMKWEDAKTACNSFKGSKPSGVTWMLPSAYQWERMLIGCGGTTTYTTSLYDGENFSYGNFRTQLTNCGTNVQGVYDVQADTNGYWSSTEYSGVTGSAWLYRFSNSEFSWSYTTSRCNVRAAFAF